MAKETVTDYEPASETKRLIKCNDCDKTWEHRGIRGKDGVNVVVLNISLKKMSYSHWTTRPFDGMYHGRNEYQMSGEAIADYCNSCWENYFEKEQKIEVEQEEHFVKENTRNVYTCDFCTESMGDDVDSMATLNPRLATRSRSRRQENRVVESRGLDDSVSVPSTKRLKCEKDEDYDCCNSCATDIFDLSTADDSVATSAMGRLKRLFLGV